MPKETLVLKEFTTGFVGSEHGADLPNNIIIRGGNININRSIGLVELAGRFQGAKRAKDAPGSAYITAAGTAVDWDILDRHIGFSGRGLFYFTSDYSNITIPDTTSSSSTDLQDFSNVFTSLFAGSGVFLGNPSTDDRPTEYFIYGSRRAYAGSSQGYTASALHIYHHAKNTQIDMFGNNQGFSGDGYPNGYLYDIPMGNYAGHDYQDPGDPVYAKNWFPVYYWANGGLRVCDGGLLSQNTSKIILGYERDSMLFNGITAEDDGTEIDMSNFRIDNWVIDKGGTTDATEGMLYAPLTDLFMPYGPGAVTAAQMTAVNPENKIVCILNNFNGDTRADDGETFPALDFSDGGNGLRVDINYEGTLAVSLWVRSDGGTGQDESPLIGMQDADANISLPQSGLGHNDGWQLYASYVYDNGEESPLTKFTTFQSGETFSYSSNPIAQAVYGNDKRIDVIWQVNAAHRRVHPRIKGAKLYAKLYESDLRANSQTQTSSEYNLISELSFELGARSPASYNYNDWYAVKTFSNSTSLICRNSLGVLSETFQTAHGYSPDDIKSCYYKTACVIHNKVYVGNVKFDGKLYPDRIMKTQVGEFDTFTKHGFIEVQVDDGDSIVHLEAFGDRILSFKENVVHIINISKEFEFLELSVKYAGINNPSQVVQTDKGVYWGNRRGLWWYNGEAVVNVLQNRGLIVENQSSTTTSGILDDSISSWESIFHDEEDAAPVLSYDPINKDVIVMFQRKVEDSLIIDVVDAQLHSGIGNWGASNGSVVSHLAQKGLVTVSDDDTDGGATLSYTKIETMVEGQTYRVQAHITNVSGFSTPPVIKFKLGGVDSSIRSLDGSISAGEAIASSGEKIYYADITITDDDQDLYIYHDTSESTDDSGVFSFQNVSIRLVRGSEHDLAFMWNTDKNNLTPLFHRTSPYNKSNSIVTFKGNPVYISNTAYVHKDGIEDSAANASIEADGELKVWNTEASADLSGIADVKNLYLLTKAIDFDNHSRRKVIQSVHFTYKSNGENYMIPFIKAYYLDGTAPSMYYMCTSAASSITLANLEASNYDGRLPNTANKFETFKYRHVLESNTTGDAVSMRSKIKNVGAIQIGLIKLHGAAYTNADFSIEEIAITHRIKSAK